jgi:hypothetical protein
VTDLGRHRFVQRIATVVAILDAVGDLDLTDDTRRKGRARHLMFEANAPAVGLQAATFRYEEWWDHSRTRYLLSRYHYGYWDPANGGMLAYHWHAIRGRNPIYHAHCQPPAGSSAGPHFRYYQMDLLEAHEEFVRLYAADRLIECSGLRPLS